VNWRALVIVLAVIVLMFVALFYSGAFMHGYQPE
jgi:uncharacterized membrane protein YqiK